MYAFNWQKWMRRYRFLTCHCHKKIKGRSSRSINLHSPSMPKNCYFCEKVKNWGTSVEIWYFVNNCFIKLFLKILLHMCDTYHCDYVTHTTFRFYLIDSQLFGFFFSKVFLHIYMTDKIVIDQCLLYFNSTVFFCINFHSNTGFAFPFTAKADSVRQRSVSQENTFKSIDNQSPFSSQNYWLK